MKHNDFIKATHRSCWGCCLKFRLDNKSCCYALAELPIKHTCPFRKKKHQMIKELKLSASKSGYDYNEYIAMLNAELQTHFFNKFLKEDEDDE